MNKKEIIIILLLLAMSLIVNLRGITYPCFVDTDAAVHAMDGIFFLDLIMERPPLFQLKEYAIRYFARYPSLGLIIYPPLYSLSLVPFYYLFGSSAAVARMVTILFAAANMLVFYALVRRNTTSFTAIAAALLLITNSEIVRWSGDAMLEVPSLLFINLTAFFWLEFIDRNKLFFSVLSAIALVLAVYSKQTAGFILAPLFLYGILRLGIRRFFCNKQILIFIFLFIFLLLPLVVLTLKFGNYGTVQLTAGTYGYDIWNLKYWLQWAETLHYAIHPAVLILAVIGSVTIFYPLNKNVNFIIFSTLWFLCWYLIFSYLPIKTIRFAAFVVPTAAALGGAAVDFIKNRLFRFAIILLIAYLYFIAWNKPIYFISGYEEAAKYCSSLNDKRPLLFDGYHSSNFIFHIRRYSGVNGPIVLRGSKVITSTASGALTSYQMIKTDSELINLLDKYAVERIIIEDEVDTKFKLSHSDWMRDLLRRGPFILEKSILLNTNVDEFKNRSILIYKYINASLVPSDDTIEMFVPSAGMTIRVKISED